MPKVIESGKRKETTVENTTGEEEVRHEIPPLEVGFPNLTNHNSTPYRTGLPRDRLLRFR